jgi:hypothetical protein
MRRILVVTGLVLAPFVGWSGSAPAAATPVCENVTTSGLVNFNPNPTCIPYGQGVTCLAGPVGLEPTLVVHYLVCIPAPF